MNCATHIGHARLEGLEALVVRVAVIRFVGGVIMLRMSVRATRGETSALMGRVVLRIAYDAGGAYWVGCGWAASAFDSVGDTVTAGDDLGTKTGALMACADSDEPIGDSARGLGRERGVRARVQDRQSSQTHASDSVCAGVSAAGGEHVDGLRAGGSTGSPGPQTCTGRRCGRSCNGVARDLRA